MPTAFVQLLKFGSAANVIKSQSFRRSFTNSTTQTLSSKVLVSTCHDVYSNLALEDWMYEHANFSDSGVLFLWRNDPCIVIGRHQNVWVECNVQDALASGVKIARRRSGGGTVYHDIGNMNVTFFTSRKNYDRKANLTMIAEALKQHCDLDIAVTKRDDILLSDKYKVSGTAAKLGAKVAYHHCTLLLNADLSNVSRYLRGSTGLVSKATASVRMPVANLADSAHQLTFDRTVEILTHAYCSKISSPHVSNVYINPTDELVFPGIHDLRTQLQNWDWIYGHTPKFHVDRTFLCHVQNSEIVLVIQAEVNHGCIVSASIQAQGAVDGTTTALCENASMALHGVRFWLSDISNIIQLAVASTDVVNNATELFILEFRKCLSDCLVNLVSGR